jgi:hypothetical protein
MTSRQREKEFFVQPSNPANANRHIVLPYQSLSFGVRPHAFANTGEYTTMSTKIRCTALTQAGQPCRGWAVVGSDPPLCGAHGGGKRPPGGQPGNTNAVKHGFYSDLKGMPIRNIKDVFYELAYRQAQLGAYLDRNGPEFSVEDVIRLLNLYGQNASRLARIYRDMESICGVRDELEQAIDQVLGEIGEEWGIDLLGNE